MPTQGLLVSLGLRLNFLYFITHALFLFLFSGVTAFAWDEIGYLEIYKMAFSGNPDLSQVTGWTHANIHVLRFIYLPAKFMETIGISGETSLRLLAIALNYLSLCCLCSITGSKAIGKVRIKHIIFAAFFIPSFFIWGSLGLRESFFLTWIVMVFFFLNKIEERPTLWRYLGLSLFLTLLLHTKSYLYVALAVSLFIGSMMQFMRKQHSKLIPLMILGAVTIPLVVFPSNSKALFLKAQSVAPSVVQEVQEQNTNTNTNTNTNYYFSARY
jgi:hypothetical protein